ncbi:hypothetical protein [Taibaiella koreensis]|uniref:hypothetical protein n=1 Tax=Taibaiella koreensis TaxID=1268548 RepID=UPI000E59BD0E|nr:hypothetical protein [Taibaiella koreensis]
MDNNVLAYTIYIASTLYLIYWVGRMCHRNGRIFILKLYHGDTEATDTINNILLLAYYLFNTGYALLRLKNWEKVLSTAQLVASLGHHLGLLTLILALTHYFNIALIYFLSKRHHRFTS